MDAQFYRLQALRVRDLAGKAVRSSGGVGSTMSQALKRIAAQARQLQTLAEPKLAPVTSISARFTSSAIPSIWRSGR